MFHGPLWVRAYTIGTVRQASHKYKSERLHGRPTGTWIRTCALCCACVVLFRFAAWPSPIYQFAQPPASIRRFTPPGLELSIGSYHMLKSGGRAGPIASTGGSLGPGLLEDWGGRGLGTAQGRPPWHGHMEGNRERQVHEGGNGDVKGAGMEIEVWGHGGRGGCNGGGGLLPRTLTPIPPCAQNK